MSQLADIARLVEMSEARAYRSLITAGSEALSREHGFRAVEVGGAVAVMADNVPSLNLNRVIGLGIEMPAAETMIDEISALYRRSGRNFGLELSPAARPDEIGAWLKRRRIRRGLRTAIFYRQTGEVPSVETTVRIERVGRSYAEPFGRLCCEAFHMAPPVAQLLAATGERPEWRQWAAFEGTAMAGAALSFVSEDTGWVGWAATRPEFRGRRIHAALTAAAVKDAIRAGATRITAETAIGTAENPDPAYRNVLRLGFIEAYQRPTYIVVG